MKHQMANAELAVMRQLWQKNGPITAREIRERLYPDDTKSQHGTVQRLLQRLEEKGFVERDKRLPVHFFSPAVSRQAYAGERLATLADELTAGSLAPMITHLVEKKRISSEEISRIRAILRDHEGTGDSENKEDVS